MRRLAPLMLASAIITSPCLAGRHWIAVMAPGLEEARAMVGKILDWPRSQRMQMAFPSTALLAGYHAAPEAFSKVADNLTNTPTPRLIA